MKRICLFFISSIMITLIGYGQEQETNTTAVDTLPPSEKYGLRIGADISRLVRTESNDLYRGFEIVADYRVYKNFYAAVEFGNESLTRDETNINAEGDGNFLRIGFDYNTYDNWYGMQNNIFAGFRYGIASFDQSLNRYNVFTGSNFFPTQINTEPVTSDTLTANWIEMVLGIKVELIANIYLSASASIRRMGKQQQPEIFKNLFVPGFGRTNDFSRFGIGYNYTISYLIPFKKKKR